MIRFEILLPLFYNDGRPIEREKYLHTDDELVQRFGATSTDPSATMRTCFFGFTPPEPAVQPPRIVVT